MPIFDPSHPFQVGDRVEKIGGDYYFEGVVVSVFSKLSGEVRYVVENGHGVLHIYNGKQLRHKKSEPTGQGEQEEKSKPKSRVQERISRLTAQKYALLAKNEALRRELERLPASAALVAVKTLLDRLENDLCRLDSKRDEMVQTVRTIKSLVRV